MSDIITEVKKYQKGWHSGLPETPCGFGSKLANTTKQRKWIPEIVKKYGIRSIADIGAGDLNWIAHTDLNGAEYKAYDLVPRHHSVTKFDLLNEVPPKVDLIMCLWVLNHFPRAHCLKALENLLSSGAKYLMLTDRPKWHEEHPPELLRLEAIETLVLNDHKQDCIKLIRVQ